MAEHEVIVCGGSLAGAATAIRLRQHGIRTLVLEKKRFPRPKLCGEFLGPDSFEPLQVLGLWDTVREHAVGPVVRAVYYTMSGELLDVDLGWMSETAPFALGISRETLDLLLLEHAKTMGAGVLEGYRVHADVEPLDGLDIQFRVRVMNSLLGEIGRWESFDTPVVVDATGYHGNLAIGGRTRQFSDLETSKLGVRIAMRSVNLTHQDPVLRMFFFPGGYGGIQPVDGGKYNLCMLVVPKYAQLIKQSSHNFLRESLGKNPQALPLLDEFEPIGSFQTTVFNIRKPESTGLLAVGDAMLTVDPATGSGMSIALQTGILAADVIAHGLRQKVSYEAMCQEFQRSAQAMLGRRLRFLRLFRPYFFSNRVQDVTYPVVKTFLPLLTRTFR